MIYRNKVAPKQKIKTTRKSDKWGKDNVKYFSDNVGSDRLNDIRMSRERMLRNYNYVLGKMDTSEVEKANNPLQLEGEFTQLPIITENITSLINPSLNTLIGEEWRRNINHRVYVVNDDAISSKEEQRQLITKQALIQLLNVDEVTDEQSQKQLDHLKHYLLYDFQSSHERMASQILEDYWERLRIRRKFNEAWKDVLIAGEEIYKYVHKGTDIDVVKCDPKWVYRIGSSPLIEESDAIIEERYMSRGNVVEEFGEHLTSTQIGKIFNETDKTQTGLSNPHIVTDAQVNDYWNRRFLDEYKAMSGQDNATVGKGEVRVQEVYWRSLRDVGVLTYYDEDTGEQLEMLLDLVLYKDVILIIYMQVILHL